MKITIGKFDPEKRSVAVKFVHDGVTHQRDVNACLDSEGAYDRKATKLRVEEVALGVERKIEIGAIGNDPPPPPPPPVQPDPG